MFGKCKYCGDDNCWGHTNDEKSAMDLAKTSQDSASHYWKQLDESKKLITDLLYPIDESHLIKVKQKAKDFLKGIV